MSRIGCYGTLQVAQKKFETAMEYGKGSIVLLTASEQGDICCATHTCKPAPLVVLVVCTENVGRRLSHSEA